MAGLAHYRADYLTEDEPKRMNYIRHCCGINTVSRPATICSGGSL